MSTNKRKQKAFKEFQKKRHFISRSRILIKNDPEKDGIMLIRRGEHIVEEVLGCDNFKWFDDHKIVFDLVNPRWVDGIGPGERIYNITKEADSQFEHGV